MMSRTPKLAAVAVLAAFSGLALQVHAQETVELDEVKVTAGRMEQELMDVNMSVSVITQEEITKKHARTIGDLLADIPGVQVNNDGSQGMKRIKIRGEDTFRTLVMIDGQKVAEHKSMSGSPMLIDPSQIERIEIIKGPTSVLYGSDAVGGAINIITKKGGNKPFEAEVFAGMDNSSNGKSVGANIAGAKDGWRYRLGVAHENGDNLRTPVGDVPYTEFSSLSVNGFLAYDIDENKSVGITLEHFDLDFMSGNQDPEYPGFFVDVPKWKRDKVGLFGEFRNITNNLVRLRVDAFYQTSKKEMQNHVENHGLPTMLMDNFADNTLDQIGLSVQSDWQFGENHYLVAGYEYNYDDLDANGHVDFNMHMQMGPTQIQSAYFKDQIYQGTMQTHALYASMESILPMDLTLTYGARYTYAKTDMDKAWSYKEYTLGSHVGDAPVIENTVGSQSNDRVVFNAGLVWRGIDNLAVRALWGQGFRIPLLQERYIPTSMGSMDGSQTYGNPDLKPETSDNFELGARYANGPLSVDVATFLSLADDYIGTVPYSGGLVPSSDRIYENIAEAKTFGVELSASYRFTNGIEPYVTLTWMRRQYDYGTGFTTYDTATPEWMARYGVRWAGEYKSLDLRADFYARSHSATEYEDPDQASDNYRLGGYTTLNLTAGVGFGPRNQYSLDGGFYNITNKKYQDLQSIYEPARYFAIKLNARF